MHVTARVAGQEEVDVEVGEACRTIQALKEAVVVALPQLRVEGFDVSVGGRALDDEGVVSLEHGACLDVVPDTRGLAVEALREAGCEVSEAGCSMRRQMVTWNRLVRTENERIGIPDLHAVLRGNAQGRLSVRANVGTSSLRMEGRCAPRWDTVAARLGRGEWDGRSAIMFTALDCDGSWPT